MSDYAAPNDPSNSILTKTNSILHKKLTEFPQYKSALTPQMKLRMAIQDVSQMPNILTKDNNVSSFYTINNMYNRNAFYKST